MSRFVKEIYELTLGDVVLLNESKSASHFKRYRIIPIYFLMKEIEVLTGKVIEGLGSKTIDDLKDDYQKTMDHMYLQLLDTLMMGIIAELDMKTQINTWKTIINKRIKGSSNLKKILEKIKEHTKINIKTPEDLARFEKYIKDKHSKFRQNYPEKPKEDKEGAQIEDIITSVLDYSGYHYDETIRFSAFMRIKMKAEERVKKTTKK